MEQLEIAIWNQYLEQNKLVTLSFCLIFGTIGCVTENVVYPEKTQWFC